MCTFQSQGTTVLQGLHGAITESIWKNILTDPEPAHHTVPPLPTGDAANYNPFACLPTAPAQGVKRSMP